MSQDYSEIKNAFLDGIEEIFETMFSDRIKMFLFHEYGNIPQNIYGEVPIKIFEEQYDLIARIQSYTEKEEQPEMSIAYDVTVTVPTKQLIRNNIPHITKEDVDYLLKSVFEYKGWRYSVVRVNRKTLVADEWQFYEFFCLLEDKDL